MLFFAKCWLEVLVDSWIPFSTCPRFRFFVGYVIQNAHVLNAGVDFFVMHVSVYKYICEIHSDR